jgi:ATP-binding cassette subfamily B protein
MGMGLRSGTGVHGHGLRRIIEQTDEKPKVTRELLGRVLVYAKPYRLQIAGMLILILASTGLRLLGPLILRDLIDNALPQKSISRLLWLSGALLLIPILGGVITIFQRRLNATVGEGVIYDLRVALYDHLQRMSLRFFTHTRVGELMSRLNNDVVGAQNAISSTIVDIVTDLVNSVAILSVMLTLEWRLTLVSVVILPLFIFASKRMGNQLRDVAREQMEANANMNSLANETLNISGALLVKLFGQAGSEVRRFQSRAAKIRQLGVRRAVMGVSFIAIMGLLSAVGTALVYGIGGYLVIQDQFTIGLIVAFGAYLTTLYAALSGLSNVPVQFATSVVSFERVFEVIDLPVEICEKPDAVVIDTARGELFFEDVNFVYEPGNQSVLSDVQRYGQVENVRLALSDESLEKPADEMPAEHHQARIAALDGINFHAEPGQLTALVGPSGAGKTTLTYLIPRLYDPTSGCIRLDGYDLRDWSLAALTRQIGMVTQETHLFHDTIRTNLLFARPDASRADLEAACLAANLHQFITALPEGYETVVGERGYRLSGGEKQRLALARVILKDPRILVLDEATSHLDSESESLIQDALKRVMAGRTSIVIAHRLSTILAADQILVMDRGQIVERGTHANLLEQNGLYAHLYETQFKNRAAEA